MFRLILYRLCHLSGHFLLVILEAETKARERQMHISSYLGTNDSGGEVLVPFLLSHEVCTLTEVVPCHLQKSYCLCPDQRSP